MIPGLGGGMNPRQMERMMQQMGIKSEEIEATKVIIELKEGGRLVIFEPHIMTIEMKGEKSFQVSGKVTEEQEAGEDDIKMVMEAAHCSREEAIIALRETGGNIAEAILHLESE